jgi:hypothetical protein
MPTTRPLIILAVAAFAAAGCGSDDKPSRPAEAKASGAPYGTYTRAVTAADIERTAKARDESGPHQTAPKPADARLTIAKGSGQDVLKVTDDRDGFTVAMDLGIDDGVLKLYSYVNPLQGAWCGPQIAEAAAYAYQMSGDALVLKPDHPDGCADRDSTLTGTWRKG